MRTDTNTRGAGAKLRVIFQELLQSHKSGVETDADAQRLRHELQVHQVELEAQNQQLREAQVRVEMALEQYTELYDFAPVGYLILQADSTISECNLTAASLLGLDRSALLNRRLGVFVAGASLPDFNAWLTRAFEGQDTATSEVNFLLEDKPPLAVELRAGRSADGRECRVVMTDVTARRQAEGARRDSDKRFRALFDRSADGMVLMGLDGKMTEINEAFARMHGYSVAEMQQMNLLELVTPETQQLAPERMRRLLAGEALTFEVEHYHRDGRIVALEVSAVPIMNGREVYIQASHRDITERRQMESIFQARLRLSDYALNHSLEEILTRTLDEAELLTGSPLALLHFVEADQKTISRETWSTRARQHMANAEGQEGTAPGIATKVWMDAIREGRPLIHTADAEGAARPDQAAASVWSLPESPSLEAQAFALQRELVVPVLRGGQVVALLGVAKKPRDYLKSDIEGVTQLAHLAWDIVLGKQAEMALRETQQLFTLFMQHSPVAAYIKVVTATESRVLQAGGGGAFHQMLGLSIPELVGRSMGELFAADLAAKITADDWAVVSSGKVMRTEEDFNGRHYSTIKFPIRPGGKTLLAGYSLDVTELKQAEAALRASEILLAQAERIAHVGSWECDAATHTVRWSDEMFRIFQRDPAEGAPSFADHSALYHPEDWPGLQRAVAAALSADTPFQLELRALRKDGEIRLCLARGAVEKEPGKPVTRLFGSLQDITDIKRQEERARQAHKMEAIGRLAGGIAHEFNNIHGAILMSLEVMKLMPLGAEGLEQVAGMETLSARAAQLVRQLLAFSRQAPIRRVAVDPAVLVAEKSKLLRPLLGETITLELSTDPDLPWVQADPAAIQQVLVNLCSNARDAMKSGGMLRLHMAAAEVSAERAATYPEVQPGKFVCLSVSDTGCGIPTRIIHRLFEPFFTTKDVVQGSGMGLATVLGLVEQHQGFVEVESQVEKGSMFRVYLPAVAPPVARTTAAPVSLTARGEGTILLVEDEPDLREVEEIYLAKMGYKVLAAADGEEALALWAKHRAEIDLLYTDVVMPGGLDGRELTQRLLADKPELPVIITSGYNTVELDFGRAASHIVFVAKPCLPSKLALVIHDCLARRKAAFDIAVPPPADRL